MDGASSAKEPISFQRAFFESEESAFSFCDNSKGREERAAIGILVRKT